MSREIPLLLRGEVVGFVIVDEEDYDRIIQNNWHPHPQGYAQREGRVNGKRKCILMHQEVAGVAPAGYEVDHKNRDKSDNRRENLRIVPNYINQHNTPAQQNSATGIKGVYWDKLQERWRATLRFNGKQVLCRNFHEIDEAARAVREKRQELGIDFS